MKRPSSTVVLLFLVAAHIGSADVSSRWVVQGRQRAGSRQIQPPRGGTGHVVRPTSTEDAAAAAGFSGLARPCLTLRGGCNGAADSGIGVARDCEGGGEAAAAAALGGGEREDDSSAAAAGLDEDLYSRQLYVMGKTAMAKMGKADVLISGMRCVCCACRIVMEIASSDVCT